MAAQPLQLEEVGRLTGLLLEGVLVPEDRARLERMLLADPAALEYYQDYVDVHCLLHWQHGLAEDREAGELGVRDSGFGIRDSEPTVGTANVVGAAVELPRQPHIPSPEPPTPLFIPSLYPLSSSLPPPFVGGPVFSYMVATLILGMLLLGAWAYKVTHYRTVCPITAGAAIDAARRRRCNLSAGLPA